MELSFADTSNDLFEQVGQLIHKLKDAIKEAATSNPNKVPLIDSLADILKEYTHLKGTQFQSAISELIQNECEDLDFRPSVKKRYSGCGNEEPESHLSSSLPLGEEVVKGK